MICPRCIPLFLSALAPLTAAAFPMVPASARVLSPADVKAFWLRHLDRQRLQRGTSQLCDEIHEGIHDVAAALVSLNHNVQAWALQGNEAMSLQEAEALLKLRTEVAAMDRAA